MQWFNDTDPNACAWLHNLQLAGAIGEGAIEARSIAALTPRDVSGIWCHFFAGIGVWSYALEQAGWPAERQVWTGSCPCQPFSGAGKGEAFADPRHLWPDWYRLIEAERPESIFGEQVASRDGYAWLDLVQADLERAGYTVGAVVTPAAGFGAPHGRHRIYFVAQTAQQQRDGRGDARTRGRSEHSKRGGVGELANADGGHAGAEREQRGGQYGQQPQDCGARDLANMRGKGLAGRPQQYARAEQPAAERSGDADRPGPTNGFWRDADWLGCTDNKWRAVEPGTFPLANGVAARVGKLRAYGNAIVAPQAIEFIKAFLETEKESAASGH